MIYKQEGSVQMSLVAMVKVIYVKSAYKPSGPLGQTYPGFHSIKKLGVFLFPPGQDASLLQDYPQH